MSKAGAAARHTHGAAAARHPLFSPAWLELAAAHPAARALDPAEAIRVELRLTDAPPGTRDTVTVLADLATGALRFLGGTVSERPTVSCSLDHADAATFLFGDAERRVRLFEHGGLGLEGVFLFVFFLDRLLQQDTAGCLAALRGRTEGPVSAAAPAPIPPAPPAGGDEADAVRAAADALPETMARLRAELGRTTPGAQLYVSHAASGTRVSAGLGACRPGVPFTRASLPIWYCCSKTLGAVALGQLWERELVDPERPVADYLPWFSGDGREHITLYQLLTHTSAVPMALDPLHGIVATPKNLRRGRLKALTPPPGAVPGARINYAPWWAWFLLSDVVEAVDGRSYERYLTEEVLAPCGMADTRIILTPEEYRRSAARLPLIYITGGGQPAQPTHWFATEASCTRPIPGLNIRGPMSDLGLFFEALLARGQGRAGRILRPQTVAALTAHHRVGLVDPFGNADWGLGFRMESHHLGDRCTAYSRHASLRTFGHYGLWTSLVFADPDAGLVTALHLNGKTWQEEHQERTVALCDAVYRDLGLV
ncbi:serine hydrolase domain-containing protein [Streptomyces sp. NEAU-Y11]|uniref:serine hydrolase domain-containing protein n=1 Tax=Streptomyces cucumeris TaxID=2962890 RepID=UPI0020C92377|nr:serine hydrolase domain-containing protein [Streptomyces sp. NEAU-Y11]MCP9212194.1 beta-lactamase family protein [Streptomyces sp. NEAU-Y11]